MPVILILVLVFVIMALVIGGIIFVVMKKTSPIKDNTENSNITRVQDFSPVKDIFGEMIVLENDQYRAVLSCSSTNYLLKTPEEKNQIELTFQRFINTISFPITFFLQTKIIDNTQRLSILHDKCDAAVQKMPFLKEYAEEYQKQISLLNESLGNNHQKNRYIIVSYDEAYELSDLTAEERINYAIKELKSRCNIITSNLEAVGVTSHQLNDIELWELLYSSFHRDDYSFSEVLSSKDAFSTVVHGENDNFATLEKKDLLDIILKETVNKIEAEGLDSIPEGKELLARLRESGKEN